MNKKSMYLTLFISLLIFSTLGCISEYSPDGDVTLTKDFPRQNFEVDTASNTELSWYMDNVLIKNDFEGGVYVSSHTVEWANYSPGWHTLKFDCGDGAKEWKVNIIKTGYERPVNANEDEVVEVQSWEERRSEWYDRFIGADEE